MFSFNIGLFASPYQRHPYQWNYTYGYNVQFVPPLNADPRTYPLWHQASQIFRSFDRNWDGVMSHKEFFNALRSTGYFVNRDDADRIFWMVDRDRSGRINEYEWCEFWVYAHGGSPYHLTGYSTTTTTTTSYGGAPAPYGAPGGYGAPAPGYGYGAPAPGYGYGAPAPGYGAPPPGYY